MDELRSILTSALGEIYRLEEEAPGIWYVATGRPGDGIGAEYYLVEPGSECISDEAKSYGVPVEGHPQLLLYSVSEVDSGYQIIRYEIAMYQHKQAGTQKTLRELRYAAIFGAESHPAYFGEYPAPMDTPRGRTLRSRRIWTGIWCLETDRGERMTAFSIPLWKPELSLLAQSYGERLTRTEEEWGYLFFPWEASCIPLFEWLSIYPERKEIEILDYAALKNALCSKYADYIVKIHEIARLRKRFFAVSGWNMPEFLDLPITRVPGAGFDFLKF